MGEKRRKKIEERGSLAGNEGGAEMRVEKDKYKEMRRMNLLGQDGEGMMDGGGMEGIKIKRRE